MFFDEKLNEFENSEISEDKFGIFTPDNFDYNMSFYEVMYDEIYLRWKYHFLFIISLEIIISIYYPILFALLFVDLIIQYSFLRCYEEYLFQESYFNIEINQIDNSDNNIDVYIFLFYDNLGYIIYGINEVSYYICNEIYDYNNYLGIQNKLFKYILDNELKKLDYLDNINEHLYDKDLLSIRANIDIITNNINLTNINLLVNKLNNSL